MGQFIFKPKTTGLCLADILVLSVFETALKQGEVGAFLFLPCSPSLCIRLQKPHIIVGLAWAAQEWPNSSSRLGCSFVSNA